MNSIPLLTDLDKLWLSFQLICAVVQTHENNLYHGDIKTDNVVLTSWNWLLLVDFAPYKPIYLPSENLGDYTFFFRHESKKKHKIIFFSPFQIILTLVSSPHVNTIW